MASMHGALAAGMAACLFTGCGAPWTPVVARFAIQAEYRIMAEETAGGADWNLRQIGVAPTPVSRLDGAAEVVAAVVDTGVDPRHPELASRLLSMIDLVGGDTVAAKGKLVDFRGRDGNGHGTHVSGLVLATIGSLNPIAILPIKAINHTGVGDDSAIAAGIRRAVDWRDPSHPSRRVRVINLSVGGRTSSKALEDALSYASSSDVLVVVAAGNRQRDVDYPAALPTALAVSATTVLEGLAGYSNRGSSVALSAPGGDGEAAITSTWPTYLTAPDLEKDVATPHARGSMVGTSMAAPHVSGAAALLFAQDPSLTSAQVRVRLQAWSVNLGPVGPNGYFGVGRLFVPGALAKGNHDAH